MRFKSPSLLYDRSDMSPKPLNYIKKALSYIGNKLPHPTTSKVGPTVIVTSTRRYTVMRKQPRSSSLSRDNDTYRDLRQYYKSQHTVKNNDSNGSEEIYKRRLERERQIRHKIIREYQQQLNDAGNAQNRHWIEHPKEDQSDKQDISQKRPAWSSTHDYVRDKRSNPNYLRILAAENNSKAIMKIDQQYKKRTDKFIWGKGSPLRHVMMPA